MASYHAETPPPHAVQQQYQTMSSATERQALAATMPNMYFLSRIHVDCRRFSLFVVQQPKQSRMCGVGEKNNRRPIDPPPATSVYVNGSPITSAVLETMNMSCHVQLVHADTLEPVVVPARERQMSALVGVTNTSPHRILAPLDPERNPTGAAVQQGVCAFTDLSVRQEGYYRLQFHLFDIANGEAVHLCKKESERFRVYAAKGFPGMQQSTVFTDILKKYGIRVRVSKSIRASKKITSKVASQSSLAKFDPEEGVKQRENANPNSHRPYDIDAIRERRHRSEKFESYEPGGYHGPLPPAPILPPPNNARPSPAPLTPSYERPMEHARPEYGAPSFQGFGSHQPPMSVYGERRDNHVPPYAGSERRHQEYNKHSRRMHEPSYTPLAPYNGSVLPQPYSPPLSSSHYSPSAITPSNPYVNATARRPSQKPFSPNTLGGRSGDYNPGGRRYSISQTTSLPPLQQQIPHDPVIRDGIHPNASVLQDARRASNNERINGQAFATQTTWPPPPPIPLNQQPSQLQQQEWSFYNNGSMGYQGSVGNEGYRG